MKFCQIRIVQGTCIARGLVRESSILEESKWFVSPYRVSISGPSDQRKPIEKGGGQGGTTSLLLPYPISALYILNHFAFALYAYRLRGKRLKKAAADSGGKKENENGSVREGARVFEGEESVRGERKISLTFEDLCVSTLFHIPIWLILPLCVRYMCVCVYR